MADEKAIAATVTGRVQGVGYRYSVLRVAHELGLVGWVRNAVDGSVEARAQGDADVLERFVSFLKQGPRAAHVERVDVRPVAVDPAVRGFTVRS